MGENLKKESFDINKEPLDKTDRIVGFRELPLEVNIEKDDKGRVIKVVEEGEYAQDREFEYDDKGRIIKETTESPYENMTRTIKYDDNGLLIEDLRKIETRDHMDRERYIIKKFKRDKNGRIIRETYNDDRYEQYGQSPPQRQSNCYGQEASYEYDDNGRLIKENIKPGDREEEDVDEFVYSSDGKLIRMDRYLLTDYDLDTHKKLPQTKIIPRNPHHFNQKTKKFIEGDGHEYAGPRALVEQLREGL